MDKKNPYISCKQAKEVAAEKHPLPILACPKHRDVIVCARASEKLSDELISKLDELEDCKDCQLILTIATGSVLEDDKGSDKQGLLKSWVQKARIKMRRFLAK